MNEQEIRIIKLVTGEMLIAELATIMSDSENYFVKYPAIMVPIPQQQAIQFGKWLPFSNCSDEIKIAIHSVINMSEPVDDIKSGYVEWAKKLRAQESGIILPNAQVISKEMLGGK